MKVQAKAPPTEIIGTVLQEFQGLTPRWAAVRWKRRRKTK